MQAREDDTMKETKDHEKEEEQDYRSLAGEEGSLLDDLHKFGAKYESLIKRSRQRLAHDVARFEAERAAFEAMRGKLREGSPHPESRVKLNVGGRLFATSLDTLRAREPNSFLAAMFSGDWKPDTDDQGAFFIDRDGKHFRVILNYLRTGQLVLPDGEAARQELQIELDFYQFEHLQQQQQQQQASVKQALPFEGSILLSDEDHQHKLIEWWRQSKEAEPPSSSGKGGGVVTWRLLYRASRDGTNPTNFHAQCDNQGETFVVVRSVTDHLFGGYTSTLWNAIGKYNSDPKAFLFTLTNPHGIPPTRYGVLATRLANAVYARDNYSATFGGGHDLYLGGSAFSGAYSNFPHSYVDSTGKGNATFTGGRELKVADVEVWGRST